jgi:hypothetical protein
MILLDTNVLARMTDSGNPHCASARRAIGVLLGQGERLIVVPQGKMGQEPFPLPGDNPEKALCHAEGDGVDGEHYG